ncbi:MAG: HAMP domain-containing histidine kinase [Pseudomonadota bacterium]|nr:HAMP domain-containing histidine kinase [Pseudomonadota bacterium]
MAQGLPRKIRLAFVTQALIGSVLIALGILVAGLVVRHTVLADRMQREADDFRDARHVDPGHPLPRSSTMTGYLEPHGAAGLTEPTSPPLPAGLRELSPGLHPFPVQQRMVYIDEQPQGRFYLTFNSAFVDRSILFAGLASLLLSLLAMYLITWRTYRISKRLVAPVSWLVGVVADWDPRDPDTRVLAPSNLPADSGAEVRRLARALSELADRVGDFVERERDFTRDASHELRTPLTVIRVATDMMLADADTPARAQRSLARVQRAGRDMEAVIDAFLILAREAETAPHNESLDVAEIVHDEVERARSLLAGKPVELVVIDEGVSRMMAPPRVLNVMLGNLLSNAVRFTERGRIEVRAGPGRIEVRDSGIGMSAEVLAKVFNPFYRVDIACEESKGMGLSIVRRLGDRFGWPVTLQSAQGEGTVATIRFDG